MFATLAYLAVQVSHARKETRRAISQSRTEMLRQLLMTDATDARLTGIRTKALTNVGAEITGATLQLMQRARLTQEEAMALSMREFAWCQYRAQVIRHVDELSPGDRISFDTVARFAYGSSGISRLWFDEAKPLLDPDAVRYVEKLIAQPG